MGRIKTQKLVKDGYLNELPEDIKRKIGAIHKLLLATKDDILEEKAYAPIRDQDWAKMAIDEFCVMPTDKTTVGSFRVYKEGKKYSCMIQLTGHIMNHRNDIDHELLHDFFCHIHQDMKTKVRRRYNLRLTCESKHGEPFEGFDVWTDNKTAQSIWEQYEDKETKKITSMNEYVIFNPYFEAPSNEIKVDDLGEKEAKRMLQTVSQDIINHIKENKDHKVTQYTANIYANIITKNLLPTWGKGFRKVNITLDSYQSFPTFEFKAPKMTQDFIARFIEGRESINGLVHRNSEINIKMSPRIFHTMKTSNDAYAFFKAAIKYYSEGLEKYSEKLMVEILKLDRDLKRLVATTKLSGIVIYPMQLLFVFDNVDMSTKDTFKISKQDIDSVNKFIKSIYTKYAAPEKEKKQIVEDLQEMIKVMKESVSIDNENLHEISILAESVNDYFNGKFDNEINEYNEKWINEQYDTDWLYKQPNPEIRYLQEKYGVKKLKKIPADLVPYIIIETEAIRDANDKMMIASYCVSKLEIVEWYIELLNTGSKKYIVPHTLPYLQNIRTQLLACYKQIMSVKITPAGDRPLIDIKYPKGYEG